MKSTLILLATLEQFQYLKKISHLMNFLFIETSFGYCTFILFASIIFKHWDSTQTAWSWFIITSHLVQIYPFKIILYKCSRDKSQREALEVLDIRRINKKNYLPNSKILLADIQHLLPRRKFKISQFKWEEFLIKLTELSHGDIPYLRLLRTNGK